MCSSDLIAALLILLVLAVLFPGFLRALFAIIAICAVAFFLNLQSSSGRPASETRQESQNQDAQVVGPKHEPASVDGCWSIADRKMKADCYAGKPAYSKAALPSPNSETPQARPEPDFCKTPTGIVNMKCSDIAAWGMAAERESKSR